MTRDHRSEPSSEGRLDDVHADAALYAADALDGPAERAFEDHLSSCPDCQEEVASIRGALSGIAASAPVEPPPFLRSAVLARVHDEAEQPPASSSDSAAPHTGEQEPARPHGRADPIGTSRSTRGPAHRRRRARWPALAAAAALVAVAGIGGWAVGSQQEQHQQQVAQEQAQDRRDDLLAAEDLTVEQVDMEGQSMRLLASPSRDEALLVSSDLPDPGENREYQLWLMHDGTPTPDAVFAGGEVGLWLDGTVGGADAVALTVEPTGGSPAPTTDPLAVMEL